jgi:galactokinase
MDQSVSLMGHQGSALLLDCRDLSTQDIPFDIASHGLELLIIDTQVHHELVDGGYAERRASCEKAVADLGITSLRDISVADYEVRKSELDPATYIRGYHAVTEMRRVLETVTALQSGNFVKVGQLLNESHRSLSEDYTVSCPELDAVVEVSNLNGALGARMVGGGFGGSAIALAKVEDISVIQSSIVQRMNQAGFPKPRFFTSLPSDGARVIG